MNIFLLRHGQTNLNAKNLIMGRTDDTLSEDGLNQAQIAAQTIANFPEEKQIEIIYCSPLTRTKQTAQKVVDKIEKKYGKKIEVIIDPRLIEQDYGELEGTSRFSEIFATSKANFAVPTGRTGESHLRIAQRSYNFLDEIIEKNEYKNILVVTHGGILRIMKTYFMPMTNDEYANYRAQNCQIDEYEI